MHVGAGAAIQADVLLKCIGFEINEGVERTSGRSHLKAGWMVDDGFYAVYEAHPDGDSSGSEQIRKPSAPEGEQGGRSERSEGR